MRNRLMEKTLRMHVKMKIIYQIVDMFDIQHHIRVQNNISRSHHLTHIASILALSPNIIRFHFDNL